MTYLSDRHRCEFAIPAVLMQRVAGVILEPGLKEGHAEVLECLGRACDEPFSDMPKAKADKLRNRVMVLQGELLREYEDRPVITVFLMVVIWLRDALDDGTLTLIEGSDFDQAATCLIDRISEYGDLVDGAYNSGRKNAIKLAQKLELRGYYQGRAARKAAA